MGTIEPATSPRVTPTASPLLVVAGLVVGLIAGTVIGRATAPKPLAPAVAESSRSNPGRGGVAGLSDAMDELARKTDAATRALEAKRVASGLPSIPRSPTEAPLPTQPPIRPVSFTVQGAGQEASRLFDLEATLYVIKLSYSGERNFAVKLMDENGETIEFLCNATGPFEGSKAVPIRRRGRYLLDAVYASGPWTALIGPPESR